MTELLSQEYINAAIRLESYTRILSRLVNVILSIQRGALLCPLLVESLRSHGILGLYLHTHRTAAST